MSTTIIVLIVVFVLVLIIAGLYNGLITLRNRAQEALADIDVQLRRRYDLIPNLVESVKGYTKQESGVLENVTKARADAIAAGNTGLQQKEQAENVLTGALRSVFAVAENYPDLKSSANFQQLSSELTDTENKLEAARRFYNANVRDYNTKMQVFPTNLLAGMFGFTKMELFMVDDAAAKEAPKVSF
jgi:LemA protein